MLVYMKMLKTKEGEQVKKNIYFVIGPTSSGKTLLSVELAKKLGNAEIICCDSRQIFKDLNIGSGKVTQEEMDGIPHHLLDVATPGEYFTIVDYTKLALKKIEEIYSRGNIPIISGGTGFYIDSLLYDYSLPELPKDDTLRKELEAMSTEELRELLEQLVQLPRLASQDTPSKEGELPSPNLHLKHQSYLSKFRTKEFYNNRNRVMRAIELIKHFGHIPKIEKTERFPEDKYNLHIIKTNVSRIDLKERIYKRTLERLEAGMLEELKTIIAKYNLNEKYVRTWGYEFSLMWDLINNKIDQETFLNQFVTQEYQYAKRQDTWFKRYK